MREEILLIKEAIGLRETNQFAVEAVRFFKQGDTVLFFGNLGSGKTYLIRQFVKLLGVNSEISSPSFSIINQYAGQILIHHLDLYRISDPKELANLGLEDIWEMDSLNFIEWPQMLESIITWTHFRIYIEMKKKKSNWRMFKLLKMYE